MMSDSQTGKMPQVSSVDNQKGMVIRVKRSEAPKDAFLMDQKVIVAHHHEQIKKWQPESDVYWLKYGKVLNVMTTNLTGITMLIHFRRKFHLKSHGIFHSALAALFIPAAMTSMVAKFHHDSVLLAPNCPTCLEVRSGVSQVLTSAVYSAVIAPITCIYLSKQHHTYLNPKHSFQPNLLYAMRMKPVTLNCGLLLIALNFAAGYFTVYKQGQELDNVIVKEAIGRGKAYLENIRE